MTESRSRSIAAAVETYGRRLRAFIRKRVPVREEAEDILQTVWYQLSAFGDLEGIGELGAWLYAVARNRITDTYRLRKQSAAMRLDEENRDVPPPEELLADPLTPELIFRRDLFWEEFSRALEELPPEQRDAFVLNELEGKSFEEIARETGVNVKTLISRKRYALRRLRSRLNDLYMDFMEE